MPTLLTELPPRVDPPRKQWTREELDALPPAALEHMELVEGELISKMGKGRRHVECAKLMVRWLNATFGDNFVDWEAPIDVAAEDNRRNEPVPDIIVRRPSGSKLTSNPGPADLLLVIEISDTTLAFDLTTKARLYARAGIQEHWVLDLNGRRLLVHRDPAKGEYQLAHAYAADVAVAPLAAPDSSSLVGDMLP